MAHCPGLPGWADNRKKHSPTHTHKEEEAHHLLDFMLQGKITEAGTPTIHLDATPSRLSVPPLPSSPHSYTECPFCHNPPNLSWLGTGIKQCWLGYLVAWQTKSSIKREEDAPYQTRQTCSAELHEKAGLHSASAYPAQSAMSPANTTSTYT